MASEKQIAANRLNSLKSTGPKTPEGKAKSRLNGFSHGLAGQTMILADEEMEPFKQFSESLMDELGAGSADEEQLVDFIIRDSWRLHRAHSIEDCIFAVGHSDECADGIDTDDPRVHTAMVRAKVFLRDGKAIERITLYEQRITSRIMKNRKLLKELQEKRRSDEREAEWEAMQAEREAEEVETKVAYAGIGFVDSDEPELEEATEETGAKPAKTVSEDENSPGDIPLVA